VAHNSAFSQSEPKPSRVCARVSGFSDHKTEFAASALTVVGTLDTNGRKEMRGRAHALGAHAHHTKRRLRNADASRQVEGARGPVVLHTATSSRLEGRRASFNTNRKCSRVSRRQSVLLLSALAPSEESTSLGADSHSEAEYIRLRTPKMILNGSGFQTFSVIWLVELSPCPRVVRPLFSCGLYRRWE